MNWSSLFSLPFRLVKNIVYFPCWFEGEPITTGNISLFSRGLKQMEVPEFLDCKLLGSLDMFWPILPGSECCFRPSSVKVP